MWLLVAGTYASYPQHTSWTAVIVMVFGPPLAIIAITVLKMLGVLAPRCPECHSVLRVYEECITPATNESDGEQLRVRHCDNCLYHSESRYKIPWLGPKPSKWDYLLRQAFGDRFTGGGGFGGGSGAGGGGFGGGSSGGGGAGRKF